jgi:hypothetical protein
MAKIQRVGDDASDIDVFKSIDDSGASGEGADMIWGYFSGGTSGGDIIDLRAFDADDGVTTQDDAFEFIGERTFDGTPRPSASRASGWWRRCYSKFEHR